MGVAYASRQTALKQRRPLPRRGQVKAAIAASWSHTLASIVHGARSVALSRSHSGWSSGRTEEQTEGLWFLPFKGRCKDLHTFPELGFEYIWSWQGTRRKTTTREHRVVQALTKARAGCQSEKKKLFDFLIHSCKKFVDLRKIQGEGFISPQMWRVFQRRARTKSEACLVMERRRASHCEECRSQENRLRQRSFIKSLTFSEYCNTAPSR